MRVLIAIDGGEQRDEIINSVRFLNLGKDDSVKAVNVVDMALPLSIEIHGGFLPDSSELEAKARDHAEEVLKKTSVQISGFTKSAGTIIETEVLFGSPDSRIVETAERWNADLIIVGSHGYNRWERLLLGSVSDSVVHHAPCSVLVVRSKS